MKQAAPVVPKRSRPSRQSASEASAAFRQPTESSAEDGQIEIKTVVRPVQNAIAILKYLHSVDEPCTATQLARALKINTSTCFNILRTLAGEGVVAFDPAAKRYKIGMGILRFASNIISEESRIAASRPYLQAYAGKHHATVCIWRRASLDRNVLVAAEHSHGNVRLSLELGHSLPVLLGSTGRAMAPHLGLTKAQLRTEFRKLRWFNAPSFNDFWYDVKLSEARGWAADNGNFSAGVLTISSPVISSNGAISYSLTALTFRDQHPEVRIEVLGEDLLSLATELRSMLY